MTTWPHTYKPGTEEESHLPGSVQQLQTPLSGLLSHILSLAVQRPFTRPPSTTSGPALGSGPGATTVGVRLLMPIPLSLL